MDYTVITTAVDWSGVLTGVGAVAAAIVGVYVAITGSKKLLSFIRGA